jgi:hypothetical protein
MTWRGKIVSGIAKKAAMDGLEEYARAQLLPLADENCPTDSGVMKGTHAVERSDDEVVVGYGGPAAPYTVRQHEDMTLIHPSGEAKWLENAFNATKENAGKIVAQRLDAILR